MQVLMQGFFILALLCYLVMTHRFFKSLVAQCKHLVDPIKHGSAKFVTIMDLWDLNECDNIEHYNLNLHYHLLDDIESMGPNRSLRSCHIVLYAILHSQFFSSPIVIMQDAFESLFSNGILLQTID